MSDENLSKLPLFTSIAADQIEHLTRHLPRKNFKEGDILVQQGSKDLRGFLLLDGKVGVYAEAKSRVRTTIIFHQAPYLFGFLELWRERSYLASIVAIEPCSTIVVSKKDYLKLLHSNHQVCINMVQLLSNLLYKTAKDYRLKMFGQVDNLVANTLCSFAQLYGEEHRYGVLVRKEVNKSEMAEILGVARRSVIRAMESLEKEGLIQVQKKQLVIPDLKALRKKAQAPIS